MNCRDVRDVADSFLCEELLTETNHEILRHLDECSSCRTEIDARRRLRGALRSAFHRAPDLQPAGDFGDRLRDQLRQAVVPRPWSWTFTGKWFALAAGLLLAVGVPVAMLLYRSSAAVEALAQDAIGDHRNCALKYRLKRMPVPLEEAAQRFDSAYRLLLSAPPDEIPAANGPVRVVERHSCAYGARRFGHVILQYHGHVVSLLMTANDGTIAASHASEVIPQVIGRHTEGLSVVSVDGARHAVMLVSDLDKPALTQLAGLVAVPVARRLVDVTSDRSRPTVWLSIQPGRTVASSLDRQRELTSAMMTRFANTLIPTLASQAE